MMLIVSLMMFVANTSNAQMMGNIVYQRGPGYIVTNAGYVYNTDDIPGANQMLEGDNIQVVINNHWMQLRRDDPEEYQRQYNRYCMRGIQPIGTRSIATGGMMMGGMGGMGGMMVGGGMTNTGMVMGNGGMAGATSSVHIDNSNMVSTIGSGINMNYDSATGNVGISGDPFMAISRIASAIGGSKKARRQQTAQQYNNGGNTRVVYVDASTGQQVAAPQTQTRSASQVRTTTTNSGVASQPVYNVYSGF